MSESKKTCNLFGKSRIGLRDGTLTVFVCILLSLKAAALMPDYQYPAQAVSKESAVHWKWMKAFYEREVSLPASLDETLEQAEKRAARVTPAPEKLAYLEMELITFPHFGMSTYSGHQQGTGREDPALFNPTAFDAGKWVDFHKAIGAKMIVFVAQHHDGFALWPTTLNNYSVRSSPWRDGKGDMVSEIAEPAGKEVLSLAFIFRSGMSMIPVATTPARELSR